MPDENLLFLALKRDAQTYLDDGRSAEDTVNLAAYSQDETFCGLLLYNSVTERKWELRGCGKRNALRGISR